jgi:hypothetical protein
MLTLVSVALGMVAAFAVAGPAHADGISCAASPVTTDQFLSFGYIGTTPDGYTGVSQTTGFFLTPSSSACDKPYEGHNSTCMTVRLVVLSSPYGDPTPAYGPWVRSCWSPQGLASGWGGWVKHDDGVYMQARAEQDGDTTPAGHAFF